jgi:hypothetical protein
MFPVVAGRVSALAVDSTNSNVLYAGAADGGAWKTTDAGVHWTPLTDSQPSLAVGSIAIDPSNHSTIYVGTGEENFSGDSKSGQNCTDLIHIDVLYDCPIPQKSEPWWHVGHGWTNH